MYARAYVHHVRVYLSDTYAYVLIVCTHAERSIIHFFQKFEFSLAFLILNEIA